MSEVAGRESPVEGRQFLIRVEHLTKTYSGGGLFQRTDEEAPAIHDVSFDVAPGETLGLVGGSGSGKTTIARTMLRLVEPTSGRVVVNLPSGDRVDLLELRAAEREIEPIKQEMEAGLLDLLETAVGRLSEGSPVEGTTTEGSPGATEPVE